MGSIRQGCTTVSAVCQPDSAMALVFPLRMCLIDTMKGLHRCGQYLDSDLQERDYSLQLWWATSNQWENRTGFTEEEGSAGSKDGTVSLHCSTWPCMCMSILTTCSTRPCMWMSILTTWLSNSFLAKMHTCMSRALESSLLPSRHSAASRFYLPGVSILF